MKNILLIITILITNLTIAQVPTEGLVGYWPFNGNANDESGNGYDMTVIGAELAADRNGNANSAYSLSGNDKLYILDDDNFDFDNTFSVSCWIKTNTGDRAGIVNKRFSNEPGWRIEVFSNVARFWIYDGSNSIIASSTIEIHDSQWHHIVGVSKQSGGWDIDIYVDNILQGSSNSTTRSPLNSFRDLSFGDENGPYPYTGLIDDVVIYNKELTEQEILTLYENNETSSPPSQSYWTQVQSGNDIYYNLGHVGIGTATVPEEYSLAVNGKIISEAVKVALMDDWPDFVFEKDYKLLSLDEVEKYVLENKHLPEISSEDEISENGINLAEMDAKLLQKIEELTLYLIELNKQNQSQQKEIEILKSKIKD